MKKWLSFMLSLVLLLSLCACGSSKEETPDPNLGVYDAESAEMAGMSISVASVFKDGFSLELKSGGKAVFSYEGKDYNLKWTLDGETFHAEGGGAKLDGTLGGGVMKLENVLDSGITLTLKNAAYTAPEAPAAPEKAPVEEDPNLGVYVAESAKLFGVKVDVSEVFDGPFTIELKPEGKATFCYNEGEFTVNWSLAKDNTFRAEGGEIKLYGGLKNGLMVLENVLDTGMYITLRNESIAGPAPEETPEPEQTRSFDWWSGDWYGWWMMENRTGSYAEWQVNWWDTMGHFEQTQPGRFSVILWDEDLPRSNALSEFSMTVEEDGSENGAVTNGRGYFLDMDLSGGELEITDQCVYDGAMLLTGSYSDSDGTFDFTVLLRPWGEKWDDVDEDDVPYYYEDWYLPLIESGAPIPDEFALDSDAA